MAITSSSLSPGDLAGLSNHDKAAAGDAGQDRLNWLMARAQPTDDTSRFQYVLLLRFCLINLSGLALLCAAYLQGWVGMVFAADQSRIAIVIAAVFLATLALCGWRVLQTSRELNQVKSLDPFMRSAASDYLAKLRGRSGDSRAILASSLRLRLTQRIVAIRHAAGSLVLLGLIGTVIGFIIALSGVDPEHASDVASIGPMVSRLIEGLSTALYTTLIGAVLNVWLMINYRLLAGGTVKLITALVDLGEQHGRA